MAVERRVGLEPSADLSSLAPLQPELCPFAQARGFFGHPTCAARPAIASQTNAALGKGKRQDRTDGSNLIIGFFLQMKLISGCWRLSTLPQPSLICTRRALIWISDPTTCSLTDEQTRAPTPD